MQPLTYYKSGRTINDVRAGDELELPASTMRAIWENAVGGVIATAFTGGAVWAWTYYNDQTLPISTYLKQSVATPRWLLVITVGLTVAWLLSMFRRRPEPPTSAAVPPPPASGGPAAPGAPPVPVQVNVYVNGQLQPTPPPSTVPAPGHVAAVIVENGSFERGTDGWGTGFYESYFATPGGAAMMFKGAVARWYIDDRRSHSPQRALRIEHESTQADDVFSSLSQRIKVAPHQQYRVTYWAYLEETDGCGSFSLRVIPSRRHEPSEWNARRKKIVPSLLNTWQEVTWAFDSGNDTFFDLRFAAETRMKLWVDDVSVVPLS